MGPDRFIGTENRVWLYMSDGSIHRRSITGPSVLSRKLRLVNRLRLNSCNYRTM